MKTAVALLIALGSGFSIGYWYKSKDVIELVNKFRLYATLSELEVKVLRKELERLRNTDIQ